jgi:hypothetical protein
MADFKYLEKQEKNIEKKNEELNNKTKHLLHEARLNKLKEKYKELVKRKKSGELDWEGETVLDIYKEAIKTEKKK